MARTTDGRDVSALAEGEMTITPLNEGDEFPEDVVLRAFHQVRLMHENGSIQSPLSADTEMNENMQTRLNLSETDALIDLHVRMASDSMISTICRAQHADRLAMLLRLRTVLEKRL